MIDLKKIMEEPEGIESILRKRDPEISIGGIVARANERQEVRQQYESIRNRANELQGHLSELPKDSLEFKGIVESLRSLKTETAELKRKLDAHDTYIKDELLKLPNLISKQVPVSQRKEDKQVLHHSGEKPAHAFQAKSHLELAETLGIIDFKRAGKIAGAGFPLYRGKGAMLEWGLIQYMVDQAVEDGFEFMLFPLLNNTASLTSSGNLPKFADEIYTYEKDGLHLVPTAEVPLTNLYRGEVISAEELPLRMCSYSPCFRREAGSYGKLTKGLMRLHQFNKVETYSICTPEQSGEEFGRLVRHGEKVLEGLGLHFRLANLPSCDLAQQSSQTMDIEIWLPFLGDYSEVSSASNCTDYQARRADIRYKGKEGKGYVHTLNCSALATPRVMIALLEAYQTKEGHVDVPEALRRYTGFGSI